MGVSISDFSIGHMEIGSAGEYFAPGGPNSVGGVSIRFHITNTGEKNIKYAKFYFVPYNAVGDAVSSTIGRRVGTPFTSEALRTAFYLGEDTLEEVKALNDVLSSGGGLLILIPI